MVLTKLRLKAIIREEITKFLEETSTEESELNEEEVADEVQEGSESYKRDDSP